MPNAIALLRSDCTFSTQLKEQSLTGLTYVEDDRTYLEYEFEKVNALCPENNRPCHLKDVNGLGYPTLICKTSADKISDVLIGLRSETDNQDFISRCNRS